jgi:23S rRNA pseudouridine2605 synthase
MVELKSLFDEARGPERIAKRLARAGVCSRRDAERLIIAGRVAVDGNVLTGPAVIVTDSSQIEVDGAPLPVIEPPRLWRFHKKRGLVTSTRDHDDRPTVFSSLPESLPRVVSVGRLDVDSEGLLLLTNDGALARYLELPATGWLRKYRVRVYGRVDQARLNALAGGIEIDGQRYGPVQASLDSQAATNAWLTIGLREGKNREIRKLMEHLGYPVNRLIRISYGPFALGQLAAGDVDEVKRRVLKDQLGLSSAAATGAASAKKRRPVLTAKAKPSGPAGGQKSAPAKAKSVRKPRPGHANRRRPA